MTKVFGLIGLVYLSPFSKALSYLSYSSLSCFALSSQYFGILFFKNSPIS